MRTPLHIASGKGHLDVVKALLIAGARVDACDKVSVWDLSVECAWWQE